MPFVQGLRRRGRLLCVVLLLLLSGAAVTAAPAAPSAAPQSGDVFFSQLLYNPNLCGQDPGDGEFVEFCNRLASPVDLAGCSFRSRDATGTDTTDNWTYGFTSGDTVPAKTCVQLCGGDASGAPSSTLNAAVACEFTMKYTSNAVTFYSNTVGSDLYLECGATVIDYARVSDTNEDNGEGAALSRAPTTQCIDFVTLNDTGTNWDDVSQIPNPPGTAAICGGDTIRGGTVGALPCESPLAVVLGEFSARASAAGAEIAWTTVSEIENAGFNLYVGSDPAGPWTRLNPRLIPVAAPGSSEERSYSWVDNAPLPGSARYYLLEAVSLAGAITQHGPISLADAGPNAVRIRQATASRPGGLAVWVLLAAGGNVLAAALRFAGRSRSQD